MLTASFLDKKDFEKIAYNRSSKFRRRIRSTVLVNPFPWWYLCNFLANLDRCIAFRAGGLELCSHDLPSHCT